MKYLVIILFIIGMVGCKDAKDAKTTAPTISLVEQIDIQNNGKELVQKYCNVCHNPNASAQNRIAPPMIAIKEHYISDDTTEEEFTNALLNWVKKPSKEISRMPGAVRRFGLMPFQPYKEEDIRTIASYIYNFEMEEPKRFNENQKKGNGMGSKNSQISTIQKKKSQKSVEEIGLAYALSTKQILGQNLMSTIQKKGTLAALEFCNIKAYPLTDSMAVVHNAKIKRVSDQPRNPKNSASSKELTYINSFKQDLEKGLTFEPIVEKNNSGEIAFYYPIITNTMCLQCHGTKNEVTPETLVKIKNLYPTDKALGYSTNELRGIWSISFKE